MLTINSSHTSACFNAWVQCEELGITVQGMQRFIPAKTANVLDECAFICMGAFHELKTGSVNAARMALLCVGICEECAEVCEQAIGMGPQFAECARICRLCATTLSDFAQSA